MASFEDISKDYFKNYNGERIWNNGKDTAKSINIIDNAKHTLKIAEGIIEEVSKINNKIDDKLDDIAEETIKGGSKLRNYL